MSASIDTCALLANVQLEIDSVWADSAKKKDYIASVEAITAIRENQTVRIAELENPLKDKTVTLYWPEFCGATTQACTTDCTPGGTKPGTSCKDYTLEMCREAVFSVDHIKYRAVATTFEEALAVSMMANMQALDEWIAQQAISKLHLNKGVNQFTGGVGTVAGFSTTVPAANWNANLMSYFSLVSKKNKFNSPYLLNSTNLYQAYENAQDNAANANGAGAKNAFSKLKMYFDIFNMSTVLGSDSYSFLVNKNALAFVSKNYWNWAGTDGQSEQFGGVGSSAGKRYKIASLNLPGVFYDVVQKTSCSGSEITEDFKLSFNGDIFVNPVPCNPNNIGILEFLCA